MKSNMLLDNNTPIDNAKKPKPVYNLNKYLNVKWIKSI